MKTYFSHTCVIIVLLLNSCSLGSPADTNLQAADFSAKLKELPTAKVIDVRTPEEFSKGHLPGAQNMDWNSNNFETQISTLDKSKPVFVYCLSGGRSSSAAAKMRNEGFSKVYELAGGIMKWRAANLPETTDNLPHATGMTTAQFELLLKSDKTVLIDFYAEWCGPCKKMKPYLDEITQSMSDHVTVIRINADDNQALCKQLKIDALPVLQIYKKDSLTWSSAGFVEKDVVVKQL